MRRFEKIRDMAASVVGPLVAILVWVAVVSYGKPFYGMSILGLTPVIFGGVSGGIIAAMIAPSHKMQFAIAI